MAKKKLVSRLIRSIEPHTQGLGYVKIDADTDPGQRFAVVCDFRDGRWGKPRTEIHQRQLDKDGIDHG